jgi:hypothetical protein
MSGSDDPDGRKLLWSDEFDGPAGTPPDLALPQDYLVDYVRVYGRA